METPRGSERGPCWDAGGPGLAPWGGCGPHSRQERVCRGALYAPVALDTCRGSRHQGEVPGSNASPASCRPSEFTCWSPVFLTREQVPSGSEVPRGSYRPRGGCRRPSGLSRARERSVSGVSPAPTLTFLPASGPWGPVGTGSPLSCGPQTPVTPTFRTESAFPSPCPAQSLPCARSEEETRFRGRRLGGRVGPSKASWGSDCTCWGRGSGGYAGRWDVRGGWPGRLPRGHVRKTEPVLRGFLKRRGKLQDDKAVEGGLTVQGTDSGTRCLGLHPGPPPPPPPGSRVSPGKSSYLSVPPCSGLKNGGHADPCRLGLLRIFERGQTRGPSRVPASGGALSLLAISTGSLFSL